MYRPTYIYIYIYVPSPAASWPPPLGMVWSNLPPPPAGPPPCNGMVMTSPPLSSSTPCLSLVLLILLSTEGTWAPCRTRIWGLLLPFAAALSSVAQLIGHLVSSMSKGRAT